LISRQNPLESFDKRSGEILNPVVLGEQHLVEFYDCCVHSINNKDFLRKVMIQAALEAKATIVADVFHEFNPHGLSGVVVIAESHIAIHSWPEYKCASVDIFTCSSQMNPSAAIDYLKQAFKAQKVDVKVISRGKVSGPSPKQDLAL
jgi:S-adenosylmethionine decarboxylase proenzyme